MANMRKTPQNIAEIDGEDAETVTLSPEDREQEDTEAMIAAEFGQGEANVTWAVKVYRAAARGEPEPYLFTCSPNELPVIDRLRDEYGSGVYRVRVFKNNRVYRYFSVSVEARKAPAAPPPVQAMATQDSTIGQLMERQSALIERLLSERQRPMVQPAPSIDPLTMISTVFGMITQVKSLFGPAPGTGPEQTIDLFLKGVDAAKELGGGGKGESSMTDIIRDLLKSPVVEKLLESAATMAPSPVTALPPGPVTVGIGEAPPPIVQPQPPNQTVAPQPEGQNEPVQQHGAAPDPRLIQMMHNLKYLSTKAAVGANVELYAEWVVDNVPQDLLAQVINEPNALPMIATWVPETAPYQTWFAELLATVKEYLTEEPEEPQNNGHVQPATPTGSTSAS